MPEGIAEQGTPTDLLAAERSLHRDGSLGTWVASSASAVTAVLTHPACRVRPAAEPVPEALLGSPAGEVFRRLVRMNDGEAHRLLKPAVAAALDALDTARVARESERWAAALGREAGPTADPARLAGLPFALPAHVLGSLLGIEDEALPEVARRVGELVRCIFPGGTPGEVERGKAAAGRLLEIFRSRLADADAEATDTLLARLAEQMRRSGRKDPDDTVANAIGLLAQAYDATAGLIAGTLLALAREPELRGRVARSPELLGDVVDEVLRFDAPIQNTRRFLAEPARIEGRELDAGEVVLVVLAAANRDPEANPDPDRFDAARRDRRVFTFGAGPHACPGRMVATTIAKAAVARLLADGFAPSRLETYPAYRPSANARIPLLAWKREA